MAQNLWIHFLWLSLLMLPFFQVHGQQGGVSPHAMFQKKKDRALPDGEVAYTVPRGWVSETPRSKMRLAQFRWPGYEGANDAVLAVFFFPGTGGSVEANLARWYGQFKQPDSTSTLYHVQKSYRIINGIPVTLVYVTGTYIRPKNPMMMMGGPVEELPDYAMLAAIAETKNGPWFFKAVGPQKTVDHWRSSFDEFVKSFHMKKEKAEEEK